jgi:putative CocE/NonD family hydrolase
VFKFEFDYGTPDGYEFFLSLGPLSNVNRQYFKDSVAFWSEMTRHGAYDEFWKARNLRPHLKNIKLAVLTVGGWYDAENLFGALETYKAVEAASPGASNVLVMGPWLHGGWSRGDGASLGKIAFHSPTSVHYRETIEFPFFEYHLKGKGSPDLPEASIFETGTNRWRSFETWPPKGARPRSIYLREAGKLSMDAPKQDGDSEADSYESDPAHPVDYVDHLTVRMPGDYMIGDQRFASRRPDVLVYEGPVLEEDLTIVGPIQVRFFVSTTGTDSDWIVKLIDVFPGDHPADGPTDAPLGGFQQLVRGDVMRGKFRNSLETPEPFEPGQPTPLNFTLQDVAHTFQAGHKLMIQVQSTWFPLVDRNPQTFVDIYNAAPSDFQKATQRVYRGVSRPSHIEILELAP